MNQDTDRDYIRLCLRILRDSVKARDELWQDFVEEFGTRIPDTLDASCFVSSWLVRNHKVKEG